MVKRRRGAQQAPGHRENEQGVEGAVNEARNQDEILDGRREAPPVALAPLVLLPVAYLIEQYFFSYVPFNLATYFAYVFTLVVTIENALPSIADIKVATSSPLSLFLWMMAIIGTGAAFLRVTGAWGIL